jgi:uncharacterized protein (TIGR01319 family)
MISIGLVPDLTATAAKLAATSAGAKVVKTYSYELSTKEASEIFEINPDIVLLTGGIDGGNKDVILNNGRIIAKIKRDFSVIVAGNKSTTQELEEILKSSGKKVITSENVMPIFGKLNITPTKNAIRELFIENIISAKGLSKVQSMLDAEIIPTPLAVFEAAELLSRGIENETGLGELMIYDVGGATTDVYSMAIGKPSTPNVFIQGLTEPFAKRTVEGDIGMRYSIDSLVEESGLSDIAKNANVTEEEVLKWISICKETPEILSNDNSKEKRIDDELAAMSIKISAKRHCGYKVPSFTPLGEMHFQTGKDLTQTKYIIGSGGSVINSCNAKNILLNAIYSPNDFNSLKPIHPEIFLDNKNILAAMGLLSRIDKKLAMKIMKQELKKI